VGIAALLLSSPPLAGAGETIAWSGDRAAAFAKAQEQRAPLIVLFAWMMAELHGGNGKEARKVYSELEKRFPTSPFTAKAKQNLEASGK
jgi:outer membrane protein assembly factor BamD (BamD/ComL family)